MKKSLLALCALAIAAVCMVPAAQATPRVQSAQAATDHAAFVKLASPAPVAADGYDTKTQAIGIERLQSLSSDAATYMKPIHTGCASASCEQEVSRRAIRSPRYSV